VYQAFVSYSHRTDARLAPVLQRALERLGTPWWRRSSVRVFRDDSSLPASAALWHGIEAGLQKSQYFVLLASSAAAASPWVDREVRWWLVNRDQARLMIVVTAGEIVYDAAMHDFDWQSTDCLPPGLRGVFRTEPHWIDLRFAVGPEHLTLRHSRFRSAALGVAAAIRGVSKDELESADILQHRRSVMISVGGVGVAGVLVLATLAAIWVARSESANARSNRMQAESRRLAAEAEAQLDGGRGVEAATLKAAIAWRLSPTYEARRALTRIDETTPDVARVLAQHTSGAMKLTFSRDGKRLVTVGREGLVLQWSLADGRPVGTPLASEHQWVSHLRFSRDGSHLLVHGTRDDKSRAPALAVFRIADGMRLPIGLAWLEPLRGVQIWSRDTCVALSPAGRRLVVGSDNTLVAVETDSGTTTLHRLPSNLRLAAISFTDETRLVLMANSVYGSGMRAGRLELKSSSVTFGPMVAGNGGSCGFTSFADDGLRVASHGAFGGLGLWKLDERLALLALPLPTPRPTGGELTGHHAPEWDAAGRRVAYGIGGTGYVWDTDSRQMVKTTQRFSSGHGPPLALSADGRVAAALDGSTPIVWQLDADVAARTIKGSQCGNRGLEDACIQRLCERITVQADKKRWRELLGDDYPGLIAALEGSACAERGAMAANLPR
jgi:hypothetical protein